MSDSSPIIGLNIRQEANGKSAKLGILPRGAKIAVGERSADGKWGRIARIFQGAVAPVQQNGTVAAGADKGWVFLAELNPGPKKPPQVDRIVLLDKPVAVAAGAALGYIGEYQQHRDAQAVPKRGWSPLLHLEVFSGDDVQKFITDSRQYAQSLPKASGTMFVIDKGAKLVTVPSADMRFEPGQKLLATAGSPTTGAWAEVSVATLQVMDKTALGSYAEAKKTYANGALWTGWYVGADSRQRTQSAADAKKLGYQRREVWVPGANAAWVLRSDLSGADAAGLSGWKKFPLQLANANTAAVGFARVMTGAELEHNAAPQRAVDDKGRVWWEVTARGEGAGKVVKGWACEKDHDHVGWKSHWAWPGFELVEEGDIRPVDMWSKFLLASGQARPDEVADFKMRAEKVENSQLVKRIYTQIDANKNGVLEPAELREARNQPLLANALSRVVARYESEWGGDDAKWNELDPLMGDDRADWNAEKLRIKHLRWWSDVAGKLKGFPASPVVYHFHPIALVANFYNPALPKSASGPATLEKSGKQWVGRWLQSKSLTDLKSPFRERVTNLINALQAAGVSVSISTTWRPPQRSYLMYYARQIVNGTAPKDIPKFVPQNSDDPVNIDWQHLDAQGKPDLEAAKKAAKEMDQAYAAAKAIGKPYSSNHNGGEAIDMRLTPDWGVGKTVADANGKKVDITSKQDVLDLAATYNVFNWNYSGSKPKSDPYHWSKTGN